MTAPELEARLTSICAEVLKRPGLGVDEDLMAAGMDSVAAVEIVTRVEIAFGVDVVDAIFEAPTVASLCAVIRETAPDGAAR
jgi:acyl carrier protein